VTDYDFILELSQISIEVVEPHGAWDGGGGGVAEAAANSGIVLSLFAKTLSGILQLMFPGIHDDSDPSLSRSAYGQRDYENKRSSGQLQMALCWMKNCRAGIAHPSWPPVTAVWTCQGNNSLLSCRQCTCLIWSELWTSSFHPSRPLCLYVFIFIHGHTGRDVWAGFPTYTTECPQYLYSIHSFFIITVNFLSCVWSFHSSQLLYLWPTEMFEPVFLPIHQNVINIWYSIHSFFIVTIDFLSCIWSFIIFKIFI
jgi:hypothetical protein